MRPRKIVTLHVGEAVAIGPDVLVGFVERVSGQKVRLGVTAPRGVRIDRAEVRLSLGGVPTPRPEASDARR